MNKHEEHLFIIWEKARHQEDKILKHIYSNFEPTHCFEIEWSQEKFSENLSRFYGTSLPPGSSKEEHCGTGPFLLVVVRDRSPRYNDHNTSKGVKNINSKMFLSKTEYREWTGGGHKVHATNTPGEFEHDLSLLFGTAYKDFVEKYKSKDLSKRRIKINLVGAESWKDLNEVFNVLNSTISYVVMRNYEPLPNNFYMEKHGDIDFLVDDFKNASFILNAKPVFEDEHRVHCSINVGQDKVLLDLRYVGDGYYDTQWQNNILKKKKKYNGFYVMDDENHLYTLIYHALVHKRDVSDDYVKKAIQLNSKLNLTKKAIGKAWFNEGGAAAFLGRFMSINHYSLSIPEPSVFFNTEQTKIIGRNLWIRLPLQKKIQKKYYKHLR